MASKLLRVTQLDAIQLDNEFMKLLKSTFEESIQYLSPGFTVPFEPEINLIIRLLVLNYSILKNSATFGQSLLLIKYDNLTINKKIVYLMFSICNYMKTRCELSNPAHKANKFFNIAEILVKICAFINLTIFLKTGTKPTLTDRVLGLNQVYVRTIMPRKFNNKYLAREVLWNGLSEVLIFTLPLINIHKIKRIFKNARKLRKNPQMRNEKQIYNLHSKCPHCLETPIQPHHMGCAHVFCYICLKANQLADKKYECPVCGYSDMVCNRLII